MQHRQGVEADGVQAADRLAFLADGAVGADSDRSALGVQGDGAAVAQDRQALLGHQHALGVGREGAVAGIGLARAALDREEGAFALDAEVQRTAGLLHRALAEVAADALVQHEAGRGADIVIASALTDLGPDHQLFDLEPGGVGVGDVVRHDVELAAKRHLTGQSDVGGVFHECGSFADLVATTVPTGLIQAQQGFRPV
ncbi:hypothetical protein D3C72_1118580 [compost metagenome]